MGKTHQQHDKLPGRYEELVQLMPPQAVVDDVQLDNTIEMIDRLMTIRKLSKGQAAYLETLTQLVGVYESEHHAIDTTDISSIDMLKYLLNENSMNASDLAQLLEVHASMGSKILKGDRSLTATHIRKLADRFHVDGSVFL